MQLPLLLCCSAAYRTSSARSTHFAAFCVQKATDAFEDRDTNAVQDTTEHLAQLTLNVKVTCAIASRATPPTTWSFNTTVDLPGNFLWRFFVFKKDEYVNSTKQ